MEEGFLRMNVKFDALEFMVWCMGKLAIVITRESLNLRILEERGRGRGGEALEDVLVGYDALLGSSY